MSSGNAYGPGIYLSDSMITSSTYSKKTSGKYIMAIFELIGNKNAYKKTTDIYVCNDSTKLLLRYFLVYKNTISSDISNVISDKINSMCQKFEHKEKLKTSELITDELLNTEITTEIKKIKIEKLYEDSDGENDQEIIKIEKKDNIESSLSGSKRLMSEYRRILQGLKSEYKNYIMKISTVDDNLSIWRVKLKMDDDDNLDKPLVIDMKIKKIKYIELEIRFPLDYANSPPYIRIITPIFVRETGHITEHGSFCTYYLSNEGWTPTNSIDNILFAIKLLIFDGKGKIVDSNWNMEYSYGESLKSFSRALDTHGWK